MKNPIKDVLKLTSFAKIINVKRLSSDEMFCTINLISQIEYIPNDNSPILINELSSLFSKVISLDKYLLDPKVSIVNLKCKAYEENVLSIYCKLAFI